MRNEHLEVREAPIAAGEIAPDFTLLDQDRNPWRLADALRDGDVVLCFYPLAFTSVCTEEMACVTNDLATAAELGATVVGVSCDSFAANKAWADQMGFRHTLLADMHREVCKAYGFYWAELNVASRGTVVIARSEDGAGRVRWSEAREPGAPMHFQTVVAKVASKG